MSQVPYRRKILLVDDHAVVRAGGRRWLATEVNVSILEAESSQEALDVCRHQRPDFTILDVNLPGSSGLELIRCLIRLDKSIEILAFSMHSQAIYAARALQAGARGYVSKNAGAEEFVEAVRQVSNGNCYIGRDIATELAVGRFSKENPLDRLTIREIDIFRLLGEGHTYTQIATA
jgi:two-component system, NarL family, invasion response regulator UvrY